MQGQMPDINQLFHWLSMFFAQQQAAQAGGGDLYGAPGRPDAAWPQPRQFSGFPPPSRDHQGVFPGPTARDDIRGTMNSAQDGSLGTRQLPGQSAPSSLPGGMTWSSGPAQHFGQIKGFPGGEGTTMSREPFTNPGQTLNAIRGTMDGIRGGSLQPVGNLNDWTRRG